MQKKLSKNLIKQYLSDYPIILEAGAHIGRDTIKMSKLWPNGTIYSFEPIKELFEKLIENTRNLSNVQCFNVALSNCIGSLEMYSGFGKASALSSIYEPTEIVNLCQQRLWTSSSGASPHFKKQMVNSVTLDHWSKENNINKIDFMWLDMQGSELDMLKSSEKLTKKTKLILIEANLIERYKNIPLYPEIVAWFENQNFLAVAQSEMKNQKCNILFKNKDFD